MKTHSHSNTQTGIDAMGFYAPPYYLDLKTLAQARGIDVNKFHVGLGQEKMAVIPPDEDIITMGANAGAKALATIDTSAIDTLLFATESAVDQSKSAGIFVHRLLNLPARCRVIELKQACYAGTAGLQMAMSILGTNPDKKILLIASDIARYGLNTSGESSQGGSAIAMVLSSHPRMIAIEPDSGFYSEDVMDFWRPNYSEEAMVDGKYSCELYLRLLQKTWEQYTSLSGRTFAQHARFCYHVPVPKLVKKAHLALAKLNGCSPLSEETLEEQLTPGLRYGRAVGNCYTAALYLSLLSLLENTQTDLADQRIGFYSYGSGCTAEFFSGIVQKNYHTMLHKTDNQAMLANRTALSIKEYEAFYRFAYPMQGESMVLPRYTQNPYRLEAIREHQRVYGVSQKTNSAATEGPLEKVNATVPA